MIANGASISWQNIIATLAFGATIAFAGWSLMQTQFNSISAIITENKNTAERLIAANKHELERTETEIKKEMQFIRTTLIERRKDFVGQPEFVQFVQSIRARVEDLEKELNSSMSTRPTTGEVQAAGRGLDAKIMGLDAKIIQIEERVRSLENHIRGAPRPAQ